MSGTPSDSDASARSYHVDQGSADGSSPTASPDRESGGEEEVTQPLVSKFTRKVRVTPALTAREIRGRLRPVAATPKTVVVDLSPSPLASPARASPDKAITQQGTAGEESPEETVGECLKRRRIEGPSTVAGTSCPTIIRDSTGCVPLLCPQPLEADRTSMPAAGSDKAVEDTFVRLTQGLLSVAVLAREVTETKSRLAKAEEEKEALRRRLAAKEAEYTRLRETLARTEESAEWARRERDKSRISLDRLQFDNDVLDLQVKTLKEDICAVETEAYMRARAQAIWDHSAGLSSRWDLQETIALYESTCGRAFKPDPFDDVGEVAAAGDGQGAGGVAAAGEARDPAVDS